MSIFVLASGMNRLTPVHKHFAQFEDIVIAEAWAKCYAVSEGMTVRVV